MKKLLFFIFILICSFLFTIPLQSMAAPATAQGEKAIQVEELLKYISYVAEGDGEKAVYILCAPTCPRCATLYEDIYTESKYNPQFLKEFQIRWVVTFDDARYLFPYEHKPGAGMKELYMHNGSSGSSGSSLQEDAGVEIFRNSGSLLMNETGEGELEPKEVDNPAYLKRMNDYNLRFQSQAIRLFSGKPSVPATPFVIIKTQEGFKYGAIEDFWGNSMSETFREALPLAEFVDIYNNGTIESIDKAEKLSGYIFFAVGKDAPLRFFPTDDAPLVPTNIPQNGALYARSKIGKEWVGIQVYENPNSPLVYAKAKDGRLQKE